MRIIHTSDLHLYSPLTARLSPLEARGRRTELTETFKRIIDAAASEGASCVIIAGDLFDSERITLGEAERIADAIARAADVTFFYLPGNHEREVLLSSGAHLPENLKIFGKEWTYYELLGVTFAGRSELSSDAFDTLTLDPGKKNVVVLHGTLKDRCDGECIGRAEASRHPIDYLALGHYHSYSAERISARTHAVYSGTPEGRGFDETGVKGYVRVDFNEWGICHSLVPFAKRTLHTLDVDITGITRESELEERLGAALYNIPSSDLVRAVLVGKREIGLRREVEALAGRLRKDRFFLEIVDKTRLGISAEDYKNDISLKGEFIRLALSDTELDEGERDEIIELGIRALMGERL